MSNKVKKADPAVVEFQVLNKVLQDKSKSLVDEKADSKGLTQVKIQDNPKGGKLGYFDQTDKVFINGKEVKAFETRLALFGALGLPLSTLGGESLAGFNLRTVGAYYFDRISVASQGIQKGAINDSCSLDLAFLGEDAQAITDLYSALTYAGVESPAALMQGMFQSLLTAIQ